MLSVNRVASRVGGKAGFSPLKRLRRKLGARDTLRLGFLGLGWIGRKRLESAAALPGVEIAALADPDQDNLQRTAQDFSQHEPSCVANIDELLACDLDGVVIATPSALHAQQAIAALEQGLAVFCQKPLAITATDTARVVDAARAADRLLRVDYCYRYVQGMAALRERIRQGELGELFAADLVFHNAYGPNKSWCYESELSGGGCLADLGVHLIDLFLWLLDFPEVEVRSSEFYSKGVNVTDDLQAIEDYAVAELRLKNNAIVRLACSWNFHGGRDAGIEVALYGNKAGAAWRNVNGSFYDFEVSVLQGAGRELLGGYPDDWGGRALGDWIQRLHQDRSFDPVALEFVKGAQLIDACYGR